MIPTKNIVHFLMEIITSNFVMVLDRSGAVFSIIGRKICMKNSGQEIGGLRAAIYNLLIWLLKVYRIGMKVAPFV
jgi:hypothetical protein